MRSSTDPTRTWRIRQRWTWLAGGAALTAGLAWSFQPLSPPSLDESRLEIGDPAVTALAAHQGDQREFDAAAFAVNLWNPPPPPAAAADDALAIEPPKPLNLQLIGIISEAGSSGYKAALYDVESDRILIVASGDKVRDHTVTTVTERMVELTGPEGLPPRQLVLRKQERS